MLLVISTFGTEQETRATSEVSWLLGNYCRMNLYVFILAIGQGLWLMATYEGTIPGWTGSPFEQIAWYSIAVVLFTSMIPGVPFLVAGLLAWRALIHVAGHPRGSAAVVIVALAAVLAAALGDSAPPATVALVAALALPFAVVVRLPPSSSEGGQPG